MSFDAWKEAGARGYFVRDTSNRDCEQWEEAIDQSEGGAFAKYDKVSELAISDKMSTFVVWSIAFLTFDLACHKSASGHYSNIEYRFYNSTLA